MVRLGQGAYVGFGLGAFGTDMAAGEMELFFRVTDAFDSLQVERDRIEFNDLTSEYKLADLLKAGHRRVTGTISLMATYDGLQDLLRMLTGHDVAATGTATPYTWAFTPVARTGGAHYVLAGERALGIEIFRGAATTAGSINSTFYQDCVIQQVQFSFEPNGFVQLTLTFIGSHFTQGANGTPVYKGTYMVTPTGQANPNDFLELDGSAYICHGATVTINTGLDFRHDVTAIGTLFPMPSGKLEITVDAEIETDDDSLLAKLDDPEGSRFNAGLIHLYDDANNQLQISFDELVLNSPAEPRAAGLGPVRTSLSMEAQSSAAGTPAYGITLTNAENAYTLVV